MIQKIKCWFQTYTKNFYTDNLIDDRNILLKAEHCIRTAKVIADIAFSENFSHDDWELAQIIGLLHDIGRFEQYRKYKTFSDHRSVDHGLLGTEIILASQSLNDFTDYQKECLLKSIAFHNCAVLPDDEDPAILRFAKIVRDADKIDIFRLSYIYFSQRTLATKNETLELHVNERNEISDKIYDRIMSEKLAMMKDIETLNDFKVLQMSWIFDINFQRSLEIISERKSLDQIYSTLPQDHERIQQIYQKTNNYLNQHLNQSCLTSAV